MHCWKALQKFLIPHQLALWWLLWVYGGFAKLWINCWFFGICKLEKNFFTHAFIIIEQSWCFLAQLLLLYTDQNYCVFFNTAEVLGIATQQYLWWIWSFGGFVTRNIRMHTLMTWYCHNLAKHLRDQGNCIVSVALRKSCHHMILPCSNSLPVFWAGWLSQTSWFSIVPASADFA